MELVSCDCWMAETALISCGAHQETGCIYSASLLSLFFLRCIPLPPPPPLLCRHSSSALVGLVSGNVKYRLSHVYVLSASASSPSLTSVLFFFVHLLAVVLPPSERALLPGAPSQVLLRRDRQRPGLPPLPQHRLQGPEAREHPAGLAGAHHPHRLRPVQGEHRAQRHHLNVLRHARGREARPGSGTFVRVPCWSLTLSVSFPAVFSS